MENQYSLEYLEDDIVGWKPLVCLIGNKLDLVTKTNKQWVKGEDVSELIKGKENCNAIWAGDFSAKTGKNLNNVMEKIAWNCIKGFHFCNFCGHMLAEG